MSKEETVAPSLRTLINSPGILVLPGAYDALSAKIIEAAGARAIYATGAGITNSFLARPDLGLISLTELTHVVAQITEAVKVPVVVDGDTGFGNAVNVRRTVREIERAGAAAIQIEDQVFPKRCGHFDHKDVIPKSEMLYKIKSALDTRRDDNFVVMARTDAIGVYGFEDAMDRARSYYEAGADVIFVEAPTGIDQVADIPKQLPGIPLVINLVEGGRTPLQPFDKLEALGYKVALCANTALRAAMLAVRRVMGRVYETGSLESVLTEIVTWQDRQAIVGLPDLIAWEKELVTSEQSRLSS